MAVHGPHGAPHPLVPGTLSAAVPSLHQGWGYAVWHCAAGGQPEVWTDTLFYVHPAALLQTQMALEKEE